MVRLLSLESCCGRIKLMREVDYNQHEVVVC